MLFFSCKEKEFYFLEVKFSMLQMSFPPKTSSSEFFATLCYGFHTPMSTCGYAEHDPHAIMTDPLPDKQHPGCMRRTASMLLYH